MIIKQELFDEFLKKSRYKEYRKMCRNVLMGGKAYSLNSQEGYQESEYLPYNIKASVKAYTNDKDMAIAMYKDLVLFLEERGNRIEIVFPEIPVNSSFERQMYIAKYLQEESHKISDLPDKLWVGEKTIRDDLKRLMGEDPIQVCGKKFFIPDMEKAKGKVTFASTMHPIFLSENLTQIIVMLKGLKTMSENPLYNNYARESAGEIWNQLSSYAKKRIRIVFRDIIPEDLEWYESLTQEKEQIFCTEEMCARINNRGTGVVLDCIKNEKQFAVEYLENESIVFYKDCKMIPQGYHGDNIDIECNAGKRTLILDQILRSAYTAEELLCE